jgi:hypothetical protein
VVKMLTVPLCMLRPAGARETETVPSWNVLLTRQESAKYRAKGSDLSRKVSKAVMVVGGESPVRRCEEATHNNSHMRGISAWWI